MIKKFFLSLIFTAFICSFSPEARADSFYCQDKIVSVGKSKRDVEKICGAPTFIDEYQEEKTIQTYRKFHPEVDHDRKRREKNADHPHPDGNNDEVHSQNLNDYFLMGERTFEIHIEEWTYNFGPERFIRTLTFENDELTSIAAGGYGFDAGRTDNPSVDIGDSKAVVYMKYGPPTSTDIRKEQQTVVHYQDQGDYLYAEKCTVWINIEEWIYDFGPDRLVQKLHFKNNRLVDFDS